MPNLVCLGGERRRGKDYLTKALVDKYGAKRLAFGDEVRELAMEIFPWFNAYMEDDQKEQVYPHPMNNKNATGRDVLITVGKVREVDDFYFLRRFIENRLEEVVKNPDRLFIITDFRTPSEYSDFLQPLQIPIIKIIRDSDLPTHPFETFIKDFNGADAVFHNSLEGTEAFVDFFGHFARQKGVKFSGL